MQQVTCTDNLSEEAVPVFASHYLNQALWFDNVSESENTSLSRDTQTKGLISPKGNLAAN